MPDDDKTTRSRFAMIVEEMTVEPEMPTVAAARPSSLGPDGKCPRCGNTAFEPVLDISRGAQVACLGCPPPAPTYDVPAGAKLNTNRYRCGRCGNQPQVTMALSDINLYCRSCAQLTLHALQPDPAPTPSPSLWVDSVKPPSQGSGTLSSRTAKLVMQSARAGKRLERELARQGFLSSADPTLPAPSTNMVIERMRSKLGLTDFLSFALEVGQRNLDAGVKEVARRTGRTTWGLLDALARCNVSQARELRVLGATSAHEMQMGRELLEMQLKLDLAFPRSVCPLPREMMFMTPAAGVEIYVDHSYLDRTANFAGAGLTTEGGDRIVPGSPRTLVVRKGRVVALAESLKSQQGTPCDTVSFRVAGSTWTPTLNESVTLSILEPQGSKPRVCIDVVVSGLRTQYELVAKGNYWEVDAFIERTYMPPDNQPSFNILGTETSDK